MNRPRLRPLVVLGLLAAGAMLARGQAIAIDGSSTVFPISDAVAQRYRRVHPDAAIDVQFHGTTDGFRKLLAGEIHVAGASRPIKAAELEALTAAGIEVVELAIATDGLSVVASRKNEFLDHFTLDELKRLWEPGSTIERWSQLRAGWPDIPVVLYGPGKDSGTFDYFTEVVCGTARASRDDYRSSEDDVVLVEGVSANPGAAIGYFGFAYYKENAAVLRAIPIVGPSGKPVAPSEATILDGSYTPLSRPLFIYVNRAALARADVARFVDFYLAEVPDLLASVGYVPLATSTYALVRNRLAMRQPGTSFAGMHPGFDLGAVLAKSAADAGAPSAPADPEALRAAVDALRDECLRLSRLSLDDARTVLEVERQLLLVRERVDALARLGGSGATLGAAR